MRRINLARLVLLILPSLVLAAVLTVIVSKVVFKPPEFDEAEVLHGSWLIAQGGKIWVDVFEHHSPLFNTINAVIFNANSPLFVLHAKLFALSTYLLGACCFSLACFLWFDVSPAFRAPFLLYGTAAYIVLTWPCDLGVVRPENYSALVFSAGGLCAFFIGRTSSSRSLIAALVSGFLLTLAVSFSPRSIIMVAAVGLAILSERKNRQNWIGIGVAAALGALAAGLLNLAVAPLSGFYLWYFEFNRDLRPYLRGFQPAADASIVVGAVSILMSGLWLFRRFRAVLPAYRNLFASQAIVIASWLFVFADHHWGRQSFGGIAVASAIYSGALIAFIVRLIERQAVAPVPQKALEAVAGLFDRLLLIVAKTLSRPRMRATAFVLAAVMIAGVCVSLYLSVDKVSRMMARLHPAGMWRDVSLATKETSFRLRPGVTLPDLGQSANLGEWLLWSRRYCEIFKNGSVLLSPERHPICAKDGSFYWYAGVHFRAMARDHVGFVPNPPYEVTADVLRNKPALMDTEFLGGSVLPNAEVEAMLKSDYIQLEAKSTGNWGWLRKDLSGGR